jgi:hypothetical protein
VRAALAAASAGRRTAVLVALAAVVGGAVWLGGSWGRSDGGAGGRSGLAAAAASATGPAPSLTPPPSAVVALADRQEAPGSPAGWRQLVAGLYARRAQAFATGSAALLGDVYVADSPALAADEQALAALSARRQFARGFTPRVDRVTDAQLTPDGAQLRLVDSWSAYDLVAGGPDGAVEASAPARPQQPVRMDLTRTAAGWRIAAVTRLG